MNEGKKQPRFVYGDFPGVLLDLRNITKTSG
jgi:hypothetical protein